MESESEDDDSSSSSSYRACSVAPLRRVDIHSSPVIQVAVGVITSSMVLDLGAETSLALLEYVKRIGAKILPTRQRALMADGVTYMKTVGEAHFPVKFGHHTFEFSGLVVENLDTPLNAGMNFLYRHDIYVRPSIRTVYIGDCCSYNQLFPELVEALLRFSE